MENLVAPAQKLFNNEIVRRRNAPQQRNWRWRSWSAEKSWTQPLLHANLALFLPSYLQLYCLFYEITSMPVLNYRSSWEFLPVELAQSLGIGRTTPHQPTKTGEATVTVKR